MILLDNPYLLWYAGFLLSFAAVLGIVAVGQTLIKIKKPFFTFSENFLVSFAIQLATVPLTAYFFYEVPVWSMLINFFCAADHWSTVVSWTSWRLCWVTVCPCGRDSFCALSLDFGIL